MRPLCSRDINNPSKSSGVEEVNIMRRSCHVPQVSEDVSDSFLGVLLLSGDESDASKIFETSDERLRAKNRSSTSGFRIVEIMVLIFPGI